jgi:hypothetical protein
MPNVLVQHIIKEQFMNRISTGRVTGNTYVFDALGRALVDSQDAPFLISTGTVLYANPSDAPGAVPSFGTAILDFGAFPGKATAEVTVSPVTTLDPAGTPQVSIAYLASVDHSADEHAVDPPLVSGQLSGSTLVIRGICSGRDRNVPPGVPFGNTANSQMPIPRRQPTPYGKWNVAWTLVP